MKFPFLNDAHESEGVSFPQEKSSSRSFAGASQVVLVTFFHAARECIYIYIYMYRPALAQSRALRDGNKRADTCSVTKHLFPSGFLSSPLFTCARSSEFPFSRSSFGGKEGILPRRPAQRGTTLISCFLSFLAFVTYFRAALSFWPTK